MTLQAWFDRRLGPGFRGPLWFRRDGWLPLWWLPGPTTAGRGDLLATDWEGNELVPFTALRFPG